MTKASRQELRRLVNGYQVTQALHTLASLGIADELASGPRSSKELAQGLGANEAHLYRLLRAVATVGVVEELPERRFSLTELGEGLRSDVPGSVAGWARFVGRRYHWLAWARLAEGVTTGGHAFRLEHGTDTWTYRRDHPEEAVIFNAAMNSASSLIADAVAGGYDFGPFRVVVDVGGGGGVLISAVLQRHRHLRGVLYDLPHVIDDSARYIEEAGLVGRCALLGGDFFERVPVGGDLYLLKSVLHDWNDEDAIRILATCRKAMRPDAKLLVVERVLGAPNEDRDTKFADLNMMVGAGGRERTSEDWESLLRAGGFQLTGIGAGEAFSDGPLVTGESFALLEADPT
ncbi:MAG: methyltransferase [Candidatus Dormibacterales bacterium]